MPEMCCTWLAGNAGPKKSLQNRHLGTIAELVVYIFATKALIDNQKIIKQQYLLHMLLLVNFGPVAAEIGPVVWSTPINFNDFRVLAALLHGTLVVGVSQTLPR